MKLLGYFSFKTWRMWFFSAVAYFTTNVLYAASAGSQDFGGVAAKALSTFKSIAKLIAASSYLAGLGFAIGAILKFKQHKDNPTQIPVGTPIALIFIAAALLFLPSLLTVTGYTLFSGGGDVAGVSGSINLPGIGGGK